MKCVKLYCALPAIGLLAGILVAPGYGQQDRAVEEQAAGIDPRVKQVVRDWSDLLTSLKAFRVDMTTTMTMTSPSGNMEMETAQQLRVARPDRVALVLKKGIDGLNIFCDGETLTLHIPLLHRYSQSDAPHSIAALAEHPLVVAGQQNILTGALLSDDPYTAVLDGVRKATYAGVEPIDGVACHHLVFDQEELDWSAWIEKGDHSLVRRVVPDLAKSLENLGGLELEGNEAEAVRERLRKTELRLVTTFSDWKTAVALTAADFAFQPPEGEQQVESLFGGLPGQDEDRPHPLVGKPAPGFKLSRLEGGIVDLAQHRDHDVVILDFWATWCGPCRRAMPTIAKVAGRYGGKGVVLYAINLEEDAESIRAFLDDEALEIDVLLDSDGKMATAYHADAIPQTVIVDKMGVVQVVHVGLSPNLEEQLASDLDAILAGKNLAEKEETEDEK